MPLHTFCFGIGCMPFQCTVLCCHYFIVSVWFSSYRSLFKHSLQLSGPADNDKRLQSFSFVALLLSSGRGNEGEVEGTKSCQNIVLHNIWQGNH